MKMLFRLKTETKEKQERMLRLRKSGLSYIEIAKLEGVTRQRVHQLVTCYPTRYPKKLLSFIEVLRNQSCEVCGKVGNNQVHHKDNNRNHNGVDNLMVVCPKCHSWISSRTKHAIINTTK